MPRPHHALDTAFHRLDMTLGTEPGAFDVYVGGDSTATRSARFILETPRSGR